MLELAREKLSRYFLEQSGKNLRGVEVIRVWPRPFSTTCLLAAHTDRGSQRFVVKQIMEHPLNASIVTEPNQAALEFDLLARVHPKFAEVEHCSVPRPVAMLPDIDAFIMEYAEGHLLAEDLYYLHPFTSPAKFLQLQEHFRQCGRWLRHFQTFTGRRTADAGALDGVLIHCRDRLRRIEESGDRRLPADFKKTAEKIIDRLVEELENCEIPVARSHGDFGPWNILAGPDGVTVIDFYGSRDTPIYVDILNVLIYLESIGHGIANSRSRVRKLRERFLAGVGTLPQAPPPLVLLCEVQQRIMRTAGAVTLKNGRPFQRMKSSRALRAHVKWIASRPMKSSL